MTYHSDTHRKSSLLFSVFEPISIWIWNDWQVRQCFVLSDIGSLAPSSFHMLSRLRFTCLKDAPRALSFRLWKFSSVTLTRETRDTSALSLCRYVLECPFCGIIYRSRQYWMGNQDPESTVVRTEVKHVWQGVSSFPLIRICVVAGETSTLTALASSQFKLGVS